MTSYVRAILLLRDKGVFLNVTPLRRKKRLIIEVSDAALGPKAIAERLKRDVRFLGPRGFQKFPMRHELGSAMPSMADRLSEPSRSRRSSHLMATDSLIS